MVDLGLLCVENIWECLRISALCASINVKLDIQMTLFNGYIPRHLLRRFAVALRNYFMKSLCVLNWYWRHFKDSIHTYIQIYSDFFVWNIAFLMSKLKMKYTISVRYMTIFFKLGQMHWNISWNIAVAKRIGFTDCAKSLDCYSYHRWQSECCLFYDN